MQYLKIFKLHNMNLVQESGGLYIRRSRRLQAIVDGGVSGGSTTDC